MPIPIEWQQRINDLVAANPKQMSAAEYGYILETLLQLVPCNLLVFGLGRDSVLWQAGNHTGVTCFLENSRTWLERVTRTQPQLLVHLVKYKTKLQNWCHDLEQSRQEQRSCRLPLPDWVKDTAWRSIIVDAPKGSGPEKPGRLQSIATAAWLADRSAGSCEVFVHDCDRAAEQAFCGRFLGINNLTHTVDRLCHYRIRGQGR